MNKQSRIGFAWVIGMQFGFEFLDEDFLGGGWMLSLGFVKIMYFKRFPDFLDDGLSDD